MVLWDCKTSTTSKAVGDSGDLRTSASTIHHRLEFRQTSRLQQNRDSKWKLSGSCGNGQSPTVPSPSQGEVSVSVWMSIWPSIRAMRWSSTHAHWKRTVNAPADTGRDEGVIIVGSARLEGRPQTTEPDAHGASSVVAVSIGERFRDKHKGKTMLACKDRNELPDKNRKKKSRHSRGISTHTTEQGTSTPHSFLGGRGRNDIGVWQYCVHFEVRGEVDWLGIPRDSRKWSKGDETRLRQPTSTCVTAKPRANPANLVSAHCCTRQTAEWCSFKVWPATGSSKRTVNSTRRTALVDWRMAQQAYWEEEENDIATDTPEWTYVLSCRNQFTDRLQPGNANISMVLVQAIEPPW